MTQTITLGLPSTTNTALTDLRISRITPSLLSETDSAQVMARISRILAPFRGDYTTTLLTTSPVLYAKLSDGASGTALDSSGGARNGTYGTTTAHPTPVAGVIPGEADTAQSFDGGDTVTFADDAAWDVSTAWSMIAVIKTTMTGVGCILARDADSGVREFQWQVNTGKIAYQKLAGTNTSLASVTAVNDGFVHHVALTYDGTTMQIYIDGRLDASAATDAQGASALAMTIGFTQRGGNANFFNNGSIEKVSFHNTTVSAATIQVLADISRGLFTLSELDSPLAITRQSLKTLGQVSTGPFTRQAGVVRPIPGQAYKLVNARSWTLYDPASTAYTGDLDTLFSDASDSTSAVLPHAGTTGNAYPDSSIVADIEGPIPQLISDWSQSYAVKVTARVRFKTGTAVGMRMAMELAQDNIDTGNETNLANVPYTSLSASVGSRLSVGSIPTDGSWGETHCYINLDPSFLFDAVDFRNGLATQAGQVGVWWDTDDAGAPAAAFEVECSELKLQVLARTGNMGLPGETDTLFALIGRKSLHTVAEIDRAQALTLLTAYNGGFANRSDISRETGLVPVPNFILANLEAGEYAPGLLATIWFEWTADPTPPSQIRFGFDWAGQSGAGGAAVRVYDGTGDTIPGSGDVLASDTGSGASGAVDATLTSPTANQRYYIQLGLKEKAGTTTYLEMGLTYADVNTFTPVIPSL